MERIRISVVIPAYNVQQYIGACLDSILNQTHQNLEVIVVNDGSTDGTAALVADYAVRDGRVRLINQENAGPHAARLNGISVTTGRYITFADADDTVPSNAYAHMLNNAMIYDADISHCGVAFVYPDHTEMHCGAWKPAVQGWLQGQIDLLNGDFVEPSLCNKMYKASLFTEKLPDLDVRNNEDMLINFVLFTRAKKSVYQGFCGYNYVQREISQSRNPARMAQINSDVIYVRDWIAEHCAPEVWPYANRARISARINAIHGIILLDEHYMKNPQYQRYKKELAQNKKQIVGLSFNHRISAWLCLLFPRVHRWIYKIYVKRKNHL